MKITIDFIVNTKKLEKTIKDNKLFTKATKKEYNDMIEEIEDAWRISAEEVVKFSDYIISKSDLYEVEMGKDEALTYIGLCFDHDLIVR